MTQEQEQAWKDHVADIRAEEELAGGELLILAVDAELTKVKADLVIAEGMWYEQKAWLARVRDSGQRTKSVTALMNMEDIENRVINEAKEVKK